MVSAYYCGGEKAELCYAFFTLAFTGNRFLGSEGKSGGRLTLGGGGIG